mgnify:CR=1 FL=1
MYLVTQLKNVQLIQLLDFFEMVTVAQVLTTLAPTQFAHRLPVSFSNLAKSLVMTCQPLIHNSGFQDYNQEISGACVLHAGKKRWMQIVHVQSN